jgi:hypothetical protein
MRGGLREKASGIWEVRLEAGRDPVTGRRRQISRSVHGTKRQAQAVLNTLLADANIGQGAEQQERPSRSSATNGWRSSKMI